MPCAGVLLHGDACTSSKLFPRNNAVYAFEKGRSFCRGELAKIPLCTPRSPLKRRGACGRVCEIRFAELSQDDLKRCAPRKILGLFVYGERSPVVDACVFMSSAAC